MTQDKTPEKLLLVRVQDGLHGARHDGKTLTLGYDKTTGSDRNTMHFTVNSIVRDTPYGKFTADSAGDLKGKIVIVADPKDMPVPAGWGQVDSWWRLHGERDAQGNLQRSLPVGDATIIAPTGTDVPKGALAVFYKGGVEARDAAVKQVLEQLGAQMRPANFWGWEGNGQLHDDWRRDTAAQLWPGQEKHIHLGAHQGSLDHDLENATLHGPVQSMKKFGRLYENGDGMQEPWVDVMARKVEAARADMYKLMTEVAPPQERALIQEHYRDQFQRLENNLVQANKLDQQMQLAAFEHRPAQVPPPLPEQAQMPQPPLQKPVNPLPLKTDVEQDHKPVQAQPSLENQQQQGSQQTNRSANPAPILQPAPHDVAEPANAANDSLNDKRSAGAAKPQVVPETQMANEQGEGRSKEFMPYRVVANNRAAEHFADVREAAQAFIRIPLHDLPKVEFRQRGTLQIGGQPKTKVSTTVIAGTRKEGNLPVRRFAKTAPQEFRDAVTAAQQQLFAEPAPKVTTQPAEVAQPVSQRRAGAQGSDDRGEAPRKVDVDHAVPAQLAGHTNSGLDQKMANSIEPGEARSQQVTQATTTPRTQATASGEQSVAAPAPAREINMSASPAAANEPLAQSAKQAASQANTHSTSEQRPVQDAAPAQAPAQEPEPRGQDSREAAAEALEQRRKELVASLAQRFTVKGNEYRFQGAPNRVAFIDKGSKLATDAQTPFVVRGMVDAAEARGWTTLHLKGSDEFKREAWLQASQRGIRTAGYEPTVEDQRRLEETRKEPQRNSIQPGEAPAYSQGASRTESATSQQDVRREQILDVVKASLREGNVPPSSWNQVLAAANKEMDARVARGEGLPPVRVYDHMAPSIQQPRMPVQAPAPQHTQKVGR